MTPERFREAGRQTIDWIARYLEQIERYPVLARVAPGDIRRRLPAHPPEQGESFDAILRDLDDVILPGVTHWQSPNFFAYFPGNASPPAMLGDLVSSGLGVQGMLWATSPACTELETHVLDWLVDMLALPDRFKSSGQGGGVIQDTASSASLCALLAARERATAFRTNDTGVDRVLTAYTSTQAHSSLEKAAGIAGIGRRHVRAIEVDAGYAMRPDALERALEEDRRAGHTPFFVCATVGTTSTTSVDPVPAVADVCARHGLWLHVDAAYGGAAGLVPETRALLDGCERADSLVFNPHKWLLTPVDCSLLYTAHPDVLREAFAVVPLFHKFT